MSKTLQGHRTKLSTTKTKSRNIEQKPHPFSLASWNVAGNGRPIKSHYTWLSELAYRQFCRQQSQQTSTRLSQNEPANKLLRVSLIFCANICRRRTVTPTFSWKSRPPLCTSCLLSQQLWTDTDPFVSNWHHYVVPKSCQTYIYIHCSLSLLHYSHATLKRNGRAHNSLLFSNKKAIDSTFTFFLQCSAIWQVYIFIDSILTCPGGTSSFFVTNIAFLRLQ